MMRFKIDGECFLLFEKLAHKTSDFEYRIGIEAPATTQYSLLTSVQAKEFLKGIENEIAETIK